MTVQELIQKLTELANQHGSDTTVVLQYMRNEDTCTEPEVTYTPDEGYYPGIYLRMWR